MDAVEKEVKHQKNTRDKIHIPTRRDLKTIKSYLPWCMGRKGWIRCCIVKIILENKVSQWSFEIEKSFAIFGFKA